MKMFKRGVLCGAVLLGGSVPAMAVSPEQILEAPGPIGPLKGVLLPSTTKAIATVLIIPGSGPTDHDGNSPVGIKSSTYRLLAEGLAAQRVTTLRLDKRGMFLSAKAVADVNATRISDYAADVKAWVEVLRKQTGAPCVWVLGHSEGGLVAMVSKDQPGVCGLVLVSTAGRPLAQVLREQLKANPGSAAILPKALPAIDALEHGRHVDIKDPDPTLQGLFRPAIQDYVISLFSYDPHKLLAGYAKPVLIVQGQRDLQVSEQDARLLAQADPKAKLVLLPDANHVLKSVATPDLQANVATYGNPDLPLASGVVKSVAEFVAANSGAAAK
jgi:pimeloyl-ACP methyl ester carboxylesterase